MIKLYAEQRHSLYYLQKKLNLDIKRLYRYANGTHKIDKMPMSLVNDIAKVERIDPNELFKKMKEYQEKH